MKGAQKQGGKEGSPSLTPDGIFRMIDYTTSPPTAMDARPLAPEEIDEFFRGIRVPKPDIYNGVDGTKVPREQWFILPESLLEEDQNQ